MQWTPEEKNLAGTEKWTRERPPKNKMIKKQFTEQHCADCLRTVRTPSKIEKTQNREKCQNSFGRLPTIAMFDTFKQLAIVMEDYRHFAR